MDVFVGDSLLSAALYVLQFCLLTTAIAILPADNSKDLHCNK